MKKFYAINGSPRKDWNTAQLLDKALEGAKASSPDEEVVTERIDLYDLTYSGCRSCFACKRIGGSSYGKCAVQDDLKEVLRKVMDSDGVIFGSPIYFGTITGQLHSFFERLLFPITAYSSNREGLPEVKLPLAFIYTMNVTEEVFNKGWFNASLEAWERMLGRLSAKTSRLCAFNTYQFDDYSKYVSDAFSESDKAAYRRDHWNEDCGAAYRLGSEFYHL